MGTISTIFAAACNSASGKVCLDSLPQTTASPNVIQNVVQIVITILGAVALLMITIAGFQYVLSRGDPQKVAQAKNAIIFAVIGLLVAIFAQIIVSFVVRAV